MSKSPQRKVIYLASLMGVLTLTSALLLALAPPPLSKETSYENLWAADDSGAQPDLNAAVFATHVPAREGKWKYIYIHQSGSPAVAAGAGAGDHFVIAGGPGTADGQIVMTQRWNNQVPAAAPAGAAAIDPACISICVHGDFDAAGPTNEQVKRLTELVSTLQSQLGIGGDKVFLLADASGAAGIGRHFPAAPLREQIFP